MPATPATRPAEPSPTSASTQAEQFVRRMNQVGAVLVVAVLVGFAAFALCREKTGDGTRPRGGIDWLLWASGSDETFESAMQAQLRRSQDAIEREFSDRHTPAFDAQNLPLTFEEFRPAEFHLSSPGRR